VKTVPRRALRIMIMITATGEENALLLGVLSEAVLAARIVAVPAVGCFPILQLPRYSSH
jgi:hypothetical protein